MIITLISLIKVKKEIITLNIYNRALHNMHRITIILILLGKSRIIKARHTVSAIIIWKNSTNEQLRIHCCMTRTPICRRSIKIHLCCSKRMKHRKLEDKMIIKVVEFLWKMEIMIRLITAVVGLLVAMGISITIIIYLQMVITTTTTNRSTVPLLPIVP